MTSASTASAAPGPRFPLIAQEQNLRDRVRDALEDMIISRELAPGTRLQENLLAAALKVSRNPVREALGVLARDGWVDLHARQGAWVHEPSEKEIRDFFELRSALQAFAADRASRHATSEQIVRLRAISERGRAAIVRQDYAEAARLNSDFHDAIGEMADNAELSQSLEMMRKRLLWYFSPVVSVRGLDSWTEHDRIIDAVEAADGALAARLMLEHTEATGAVYPFVDAGTPEVS